MKYLTATLLLAGGMLMSGVAYADSEDQQWVAQCVRDNAAAAVPTLVLFKYCKCMTNKMDDNETKSVTEWEPSHPEEKAKCQTRAQWNSSTPPASPTPGQP